MTAGMDIRVSGTVIDVNDLERMAGFWGGLLGLGVTRRVDGWVGLGTWLELQRVDEVKAVKNRLHLDLRTDDLPAAAAHAAALGATPAGGVREVDGAQWQVWRDPEGNEFCLCTS